MSGTQTPQLVNAITQFVNGTQANWNQMSIPIPNGLLVYATDTTVVKIGDGVTLYVNLPVAFTISDIVSFANTFSSLEATVTSTNSTILALQADYNTIVAQVQTTSSGLAGTSMPVVSDLNSAPLGWSSWSAATLNLPAVSSSGVLLTVSNTGTITPATGNWIDQYAYSTGNVQYFRQNISNGVWTTWRQVVPLDTAQAIFAGINGSPTQVFNAEMLTLTSSDGKNTAQIYTDPVGTGTAGDVVFKVGVPGAYQYIVLQGDGRITAAAQAAGANDLVTLSQAQGNFAALNGSATQNFTSGRFISTNNNGLTFSGSSGYYEMDAIKGSVNVPVGGNFTAQDTAGTLVPVIMANAVGLNQGMPLGQAFEVFIITTNTTITPSAYITEAICTATTSIAVDVVAGTFAGQSVSVKGIDRLGKVVTVSVSTGMMYFPDGSTLTSITLFPSYAAEINMVWDGINWRCRTYGLAIVAPAQANNHAVPLGQLIQTAQVTGTTSFLFNSISAIITTSSLSPFTITIMAGTIIGQQARLYGTTAIVTIQNAAGGPVFLFPDSSTSSSYIIPANTQGTQGIDIIWDGINWRCQTFGQTIIANATAPNQAVTLGQLPPALGTTYTDVTTSRTLGTVYTNSTARPLVVVIYISTQGSQGCSFSVAGIAIAAEGSGSTVTKSGTLTAIIPTGATYELTGNGSIGTWMEL